MKLFRSRINGLWVSVSTRNILAVWIWVCLVTTTNRPVLHSLNVGGHGFYEIEHCLRKRKQDPGLPNPMTFKWEWRILDPSQKNMVYGGNVLSETGEVVKPGSSATGTGPGI